MWSPLSCSVCTKSFSIPSLSVYLCSLPWSGFLLGSFIEFYFFNSICHTMFFNWRIYSIDILDNNWLLCISCHFNPCFPIGFILFFFLLWFDDFLLYYAFTLFILLFVNVLYGFDWCLPCFSSMLTPSYIYLLLTASHIGSNTF